MNSWKNNEWIKNNQLMEKIINGENNEWIKNKQLMEKIINGKKMNEWEK